MPQPAFVDSEIPQAILMPFENGDIARVTLSLYKAPKGQNRPIDAYVVTECEGDFTGAARRAAEAVYKLAQKKLPRIGQMVIGIDIQGLSPGSAPVTGESCGLSFAVAIAGELFKKNQTVAATGVISSSVNGKIDRVDGITEKITIAAEIIPQQGRILYPTDNHDEIPESIFKLARDKRITLHPVATIAEAIYAAYGIKAENNPADNRSRLKKISAVIIVLLAITICAVFLFNKEHQKAQPPAQSFPSAETETNAVAEKPDTTPTTVKESDKKDIAGNIVTMPQESLVQEKDPIQPVLTNSRTEEELTPQQPSPVSEKITDQHLQNTPHVEEKPAPTPAQASPEPVYKDSGFE